MEPFVRSGRIELARAARRLSQIARCWRFALLLAGSQACSQGLHQAAHETGQPATPVPTATSAAPNASNTGAPLEVPVRPEPVLLVTDGATLDYLELHGFAFDALLSAPAGDQSASAARVPRNNRELYASDAYRSWVRVIEHDLAAAAAADPSARPSVAGSAHRLFDVRWLRSAAARFELVAVVNRFDRQPLTAGCGEVRLIYRLAYRQQTAHAELASRLPFTVGLEFEVPRVPSASSCADALRDWVPEHALGSEASNAWLAQRLGRITSSPERRLQLVVNVQLVRWPSAVRPDLGGHAEYVLRAFRPRQRGAGFEPSALENTPDTDKLLRQPELRRALLTWLREPAHRLQIDAGTAIVPAQFLAQKVLSVTPRAWSRRSNRPYRQIFQAKDFADLPLAELRYASSAEAFLRRLDDLTCSGCHQARSVAGFHLLGADASNGQAGNALVTPLSPHLVEDLERRSAQAQLLLQGNDADLSRPLAEHTRAAPGVYGAHCGLGDVGFASWTCASGLRCELLDAPADDAHVGSCLPLEPEVGDPCEIGALRAARHPLRDRVARVQRRACAADASCNGNAVGFPGGLCRASCESQDPHLGCGVIAQLTPFNACLARQEPFATCLREHVEPAGLRRCSEQEPCRDDYVCSRGGDGLGTCIPPYFLFQLRVDGHTTPP